MLIIIIIMINKTSKVAGNRYIKLKLKRQHHSFSGEIPPLPLKNDHKLSPSQASTPKPRPTSNSITAMTFPLI
jgi:hypothetical protein